ncbi:MAG: hypothetical protein EAZ99_15635 [Alphaproteobacteria bacterium]|nr:MAG: hypothetical protein EAZ99_15635 [Alphaproteobacteria bacterium]
MSTVPFKLEGDSFETIELNDVKKSKEYFVRQSKKEDVDTNSEGATTKPTERSKEREVKKNIIFPNFKAETIKIENYFFKKVQFNSSEFKKVTFKSCKFEDCLFVNAHFISVEFHDVEFKNCNLWKASFEKCYVDPKIFKFDSVFERDAPNIALTLYHALLKNSREECQMERARNSDLEFKRWMHLNEIYEVSRDGPRTNALSKLLRLYKWKYHFLRFFSNHGYGPGRLLIWTTVLFGAVSWLNYFVIGSDLSISGNRVDSISFIDALYYTFSILTLLGFSFIVPDSTCAKILTIFEALCSVGWLGYLQACFVKRYLP